jgi:hypothetical protein
MVIQNECSETGHGHLESKVLETLHADDEEARIMFQDYCQDCGEPIGRAYTRFYKYEKFELGSVAY